MSTLPAHKPAGSPASSGGQFDRKQGSAPTSTLARPTENERHPISDWQYEVANGDTRRGYDDWVAANIESDTADLYELNDEISQWLPPGNGSSDEAVNDAVHEIHRIMSGEEDRDDRLNEATHAGNRILSLGDDTDCLYELNDIIGNLYPPADDDDVHWKRDLRNGDEVLVAVDGDDGAASWKLTGDPFESEPGVWKYPAVRADGPGGGEWRELAEDEFS